jgi:hypothetical protein
MRSAVVTIEESNTVVSKNELLGDQFLPLSKSPWQKTCMWLNMGPNSAIVKKHEAKFRTILDPVWVFPQVSVNVVDCIDSASQTFRTRYTFFINVSITSEDFDQYSKDPVNFRPSYFPNFMPYNAVLVDRMEPVVNPDGSIFSLTVQRGLWVAGCFIEHCVSYSSPFVLSNFPFDVQSLEIKFEIRDNHMSWYKNRPQMKVMIEPYYGGPGDSCACFGRLIPTGFLGKQLFPIQTLGDLFFKLL